MPPIRSRVVAQLRNVHEGLATRVAEGLRLKEMPDPAPAAKPTRTDLQPSPALSILRNGPESFRGRKLGVLVTDGVDAQLLESLLAEVAAVDATAEIVAPSVGGVAAADGTWIDAKEKLAGAPSVLYDAVALLVSEEGVDALLVDPAARDFVADALAHKKLIGYATAALPLLDREGADPEGDAGLAPLQSVESCKSFVELCGTLRFWERPDGAA